MFTFLATLCAGLFSGAAAFISLVEHWARLQAGPAVGLVEFHLGFTRARAMQASLAVSTAFFAAIAWLGGRGATWLLVAVLFVGVVGFTVLRIQPVYERILDPSLTAESPEALPLLREWGRLHHVRSVLGFLAFLLAVAAR